MSDWEVTLPLGLLPPVWCECLSVWKITEVPLLLLAFILLPGSPLANRVWPQLFLGHLTGWAYRNKTQPSVLSHDGIQCANWSKFSINKCSSVARCYQGVCSDMP